VFNFFKRLNEQPVCRILRFFLNFSRLAVTLIAVYVWRSWLSRYLLSSANERMCTVELQEHNHLQF